MRFNDYVGMETSYREYKILSMIFEEDLSHEYGSELIRTGKWVFNSTIINTLTIYFKKYLAKYIASFSSKMSVSENEFASLYIGIDDKGIVKGIPFEGTLEINFLINLIDNVFSKTLYFIDEENKVKIRNNIKLKLINVEYEKKMLTDTNDLYNELIKTEKNKKELEDKYDRIRKFRANIVNGQNSKLSDMLNNERLYYRNTQFFYDNISISKYKHTYSHLYYLCDVPDYYDMMVDIKIKTFEKIYDYEIKQHVELKTSSTKIPHYKINKIITLFRFARYKDYTSHVFNNFKIKKPPRKRFHGNLPQFLLSQNHRITEKWLINNNLNLYVIKIDIPMSILDSGEVMYFNEKKRKFEECYRSFDKKGPITKKIKDT